MTKIMDIEPGICEHVRVEFYCNTWEEFDRVVKWLHDQGVRLGKMYWPTDKEQEKGIYSQKVPIIMDGKRPKWMGNLVNTSLDSRHDSYEGEENGVSYEVFTPEFVRT
jgi:hypothetical protein